MPYVSHVPVCFTCLHALRPFMPLLPMCLPLFTCLTCIPFFTCLTWLHLFTSPTFLHFFTCLQFFYMPYVPSDFTCLTRLHIFTCLTCPHFFTSLTCLHCFTCLHFLPALRAFIYLHVYILFMYMLTKLTQINENLSSFIKYFHFYITRVIFSMSFSFFQTENINYF